MISIKDIYKIYSVGQNKVYALNGISLNIEKGEFTAIIGPSGSGKSTLMNMIGCLDVPTTGSYILDGEEVSNLKDDQLSAIRNKKIGFVFQSFNLLTKLNALENVELPMIYRKIPKNERLKLAMKALERVELSDRIKHRPVELSGGQQQRVAIARAIAAKPSIILADEPTGALDSRSGAEIMNILRELHSDGSTIILITHDKDIAAKADRVINIRDGKLTSDLPNVK